MRTLSLRFLKISQYLTLLCHFSSFLFFGAVHGECSSGFELACEWFHDEKSALKWVHNKDSEGSVVELKECEFPDCGVGVITTPWLNPRGKETSVTLNYKIYGTSNVYLRLYMRTEDSAQHQIFSQTGNYAHEFPTYWTEKNVLIPATSSKHRLVLKAYTPYKEAYVAVKDITLKGNTLKTSTPTQERENEDESQYSLSGYSRNSALNTQALKCTFLSTSLNHYLKYFHMILLAVLITRMNWLNYN